MGTLCLALIGVLCCSETSVTTEEDLPFIHKARQCEQYIWGLKCAAGIATSVESVLLSVLCSEVCVCVISCVG